MINTKTISNQHARCGCIMIRVTGPSSSPTAVEHSDCSLQVNGLLLAIDCNVCKAFHERRKRPDLLVLREVNHKAQWLVIEIKSTARMKAIQQLNAGLNSLANSSLFLEFAHDRPRAVLATKRQRTADLGWLRKPLDTAWGAVFVQPVKWRFAFQVGVRVSSSVQLGLPA